MKRTNLILLLFLLLFIFSCEKEFDYDLIFKEKIVISGFLTAEEPVKIYIQKNFFDYLNKEYLTDRKSILGAQVYLYENNKKIGKLFYQTDSIDSTESYYTIDYLPKVENRYKIKVYVDGYDTLFAETYIPEKPIIDTVKVLDTQEDSRTVSIIVVIRDDPSEKNFYSIVFDQVANFSDDPIIENRKNGVYIIDYPLNNYPPAFFSDEMINQTYALTLKRDTGFLPNIKVSPGIKLYSISREIYLYYKSLAQQSSTGENPFTEPVVLFSNINNGVGIFGGVSYVCSDSVYFER